VGRERHRPRDRRRDQAAGQDRRHLDRARRRHDAGGDDQADPAGPDPADESIVVSITGNGLKTLEVVADDLPYPQVIDAKLSEFDRLIDQQQERQEKPGASGKHQPALANAIA
jgi:hypothetical protein